MQVSENSGPTPRVSILLPAYGVADLMGEAIRSLQAQTIADWEAIVIDDGDPAVAEAFAPHANDGRLRLLRTDNRGLATARNRAAAQARAPNLALLDGDDAFEPDYLARMLGMLEADPTLGFVTCDARYVGLADRAGQRFSASHPQLMPADLASVLERRFNVFVGVTMRRDAFAAVGGFDQAFSHVEDFDLWLRLMIAGYRLGYAAVPLVRYRRRAGSLSRAAVAMTNGAVRAYRKAEIALAGRPEQAIARAMRRRSESERARLRAEAMILAGQTRRGIALLARHRERTGRWRYAVPVMRVLPMLAGTLLRLRARMASPGG